MVAVWCLVKQPTTHGAMLPSTAPSGADPDSHHHSCLHLLTHRHLHHRGPYRPDQDLHLWVFKGRGSSTCSAQICLGRIAWRRLQHKLTLSRSGRTRPGAPQWAWGSTETSLADAQGSLNLKWYSVHLFFAVCPQVDGTDEDKDSTAVSSSQTSDTTSGTTVTTTTTHISKASMKNPALAFFSWISCYLHLGYIFVLPSTR